MKTCFVAMPFGSKERDPEKHQLWTEVYFDHIKPTVESIRKDLKCIRADEIARPGSIIRDVIDRLATADIVVVEMTDQNPNVFYELGVRHALSNRTILISQRTEDIPFDLKDYRTIIYKFTPKGVKEFEQELRKYIIQISDNPDYIDNPVQAYIRETQYRLNKSINAGESSAEMQTYFTEVYREIEEIRGQNYRLASTVAELREVITGFGSDELIRGRVDLSGTWLDTAFGNEMKYASYINETLIFAYEGRWPGVYYGKVEANIFRFSWTRFDKTLDGKGYLKINDTQNELNGGIWFDDSDIDQMLTRNEFLEKHQLIRDSIQIDSSGMQVLDKAKQFLRNIT